MKWCEIEALSEQFGPEKRAKNDGYYRISKENEAIFQLSFAKTGPCGESLYQPLIKLRQEEDRAIPYYLLDVAAQPMKRLQRANASDIEALNQAFADLIEEFYCEVTEIRTVEHE
jgi:hypothetical protein